MGVNGLGWVWRGCWNCYGWHRVVGKVWDGYEVLGWLRRVWEWDGGLRVGVKGQRIVWRPSVGIEGLILV